MKKFKLDLNQLEVDSFETAKTNSEKGTIKGFLPTRTENDFTMISCYDPTCADSCYESCVSNCQSTGPVPLTI